MLPAPDCPEAFAGATGKGFPPPAFEQPNAARTLETSKTGRDDELLTVDDGMRLGRGDSGVSSSGHQDTSTIRLTSGGAPSRAGGPTVPKPRLM